MVRVIHVIYSTNLILEIGGDHIITIGYLYNIFDGIIAIHIFTIGLRYGYVRIYVFMQYQGQAAIKLHLYHTIANSWTQESRDLARTRPACLLDR